MSLKDKLKQRAQVSNHIEEASLKDLPLAFRQDLLEFNRSERLKTVYSGIHKDQFVQVSLAPGNGSAFLSVYFRNDGYLSQDDIEIILSNVGVVHGLLLGALKPFFVGKVLKRSFKKLRVARGTAVTPGKSGHIELLKRPYNSSENRDLESFDQVAPEDEIAFVHPPIRGIPGMTVLGEEIAPPAIQMEELQVKSNINSVTSEDRTVLIATTAGYIVHYNNEISVNPELKIDKEVTIHRGNLVYGSDVTIMDNIREKVSMNIGGNLTVMGLVNEAQIHVDKNLTIDKGIFGKSESSIFIGAELKCRYLNEVTIDCEGSIGVEKEVLNSHVWTRSGVISPRAVLVGGTMFSHEDLELNAIGSELGLKSLVVVGLDKREYRIQHELMPLIEELKEKLASAEELLPTAPPQNKESLEDRIAELRGEIEARENEIRFFQDTMKEKNPEAKVTVHSGIFPGTTIMIANESYTVFEKIEGAVVLSLKEQNFKIERLSKA